MSRLFKTAQFDRGTLSNVWAQKRGKKSCKTHGATFPVELVEKAVSNFTEEGALILDPFMGSGTTGVACKNLKRSFIGIELDEGYFKFAKNRIENNEQ